MSSAGAFAPPADVRALGTVRWGEGLALRYGGFYGPGTGISLDPDAMMAAPVRKRRFPIVGDGGGIWSLVHIEDAAAATAVAVERGERGIYNVVDDDPAPVRDWLPLLASALGAKPPRRVPRWLGRLLAGETATVMMTEVSGASPSAASCRPRGHRVRSRGARSRGSDVISLAQPKTLDGLPGWPVDGRLNRIRRGHSCHGRDLHAMAAAEGEGPLRTRRSSA